MTTLESFLLDVYLGELVTPGFRPDCNVYYDREDLHFKGCDAVQVTVKFRYDHEDHVEIQADFDCGTGDANPNRVAYRFKPVPWILERK
jgi:hypothetical protein